MRLSGCIGRVCREAREHRASRQSHIACTVNGVRFELPLQPLQCNQRITILSGTYVPRDEQLVGAARRASGVPHQRDPVLPSRHYVSPCCSMLCRVATCCAVLQHAVLFCNMLYCTHACTHARISPTRMRETVRCMVCAQCCIFMSHRDTVRCIVSVRTSSVARRRHNATKRKFHPCSVSQRHAT